MLLLLLLNSYKLPIGRLFILFQAKTLRRKGFIDKKDYYGYSVYASAKVAPKWRTFARYDLMDSSNPDNFTSPWNSLDGQLMMIGAEFQPLKQLKIAPNSRNINADRGKAEQYFFINLEINL